MHETKLEYLYTFDFKSSRTKFKIQDFMNVMRCISLEFSFTFYFYNEYLRYFQLFPSLR